jgi:hypothetical protein
MPKTKRQIAREVNEILARPLPRHAQDRRVPVDHTLISRHDLRIAKNNAKSDPDGQIFPWLPLYPLAGSTVYYDGKLWVVGRKNHGDVQLAGAGHDAVVTAPRDELRPVSWTQRDENSLERA